MQSNSDDFPEKNSGNAIPYYTRSKANLSLLLHNISIAALVGVIAFTGVSSLIIAASKNSLNEMEKTEIE
ncbi:hypothetical protein AFK68_12250 [Hydrocoleum sp. CS-953]|uniref:hypothetical protein n=1 Tax=Hydrocoleum sp. CS-953 TaxID=1671698 RepID=UPI000B9BB15A|nr:hypothetical protein [Hydrocoleum sp. CS-953]OZH54225.1 hypothetical protein AFK68_12250 [Hydrocoleum sp. CS-953]